MLGTPGVVPGRRRASWSSWPAPARGAGARSPATGCPPRATRASSTSTTRTIPAGTGPRQPRPRPRHRGRGRVPGPRRRRARGGWSRPPRPVRSGSGRRWPGRSSSPPSSARPGSTQALGLAAIAGRFADGDLAAILDHLAAEPARPARSVTRRRGPLRPARHRGWAAPAADSRRPTMTRRQSALTTSVLTGEDAANRPPGRCAPLGRARSDQASGWPPDAASLAHGARATGLPRPRRDERRPRDRPT